MDTPEIVRKRGATTMITSRFAFRQTARGAGMTPARATLWMLVGLGSRVLALVAVLAPLAVAQTQPRGSVMRVSDADDSVVRALAQATVFTGRAEIKPIEFRRMAGGCGVKAYDLPGVWQVSVVVDRVLAVAGAAPTSKPERVTFYCSEPVALNTECGTLVFYVEPNCADGGELWGNSFVAECSDGVRARPQPGSAVAQIGVATAEPHVSLSLQDLAKRLVQQRK